MILAESGSQWSELARKVRFLQQASSYPEKTGTVAVIETHMSWVFLTDLYAYKLKKPVQLPFLDYTSLASRHLSTKAEFDNNSQLAPEVYIGIIPLLMGKNGEYSLGEGSKEIRAGRIVEESVTVVDWVLKMKRLPRHLMLDQAITARDFSSQKLLLAAQKLAEFYLVADRIPVTPEQYLQTLTAISRENCNVLSSQHYGLDPGTVKSVHEAQLEQLQCCRELLVGRVQEGRIIDGHGDLRPEHICLTDPPVLIDRLELPPAQRAVDPIDELSFLWIECQLLGHSGSGDVFFDTYRAVSHDHYPTQLLPLFKSMRACTRAKISAWHLDDQQVQDKAKWRRRTAEYFALSSIILG